MPVVEEMKSLSRSKVIKSTEVTVGQRKEIDFNTFYLQKVLREIVEAENDASEEVEEPIEEEISEEEKLQQILDQTNAECEILMENAKRDAEIILEEAYSDSQKITENARQEGFQKGYQEGQEAGFKEYQELLEEVKAMKQEVLDEKRRTAMLLEKDLIQLVIQSVKKVIKHEISENHELILNLIQEGINKCTFTESLIIRVSDVDYDLISVYKNRVYMMTEGIEDIEIKADASLNSGSIIIETASGRIDASIETQVKVVENLFNELLQSE